MTDPVPPSLAPPTDARLLSAFAAGDDASLAALAHRHEPALLGLARGLLSQRDDLARDAVQETWLRVIRHARKFDGRSSFTTWVYRILINRCHDLRTSQHRHSQPASSAASEPMQAPIQPGREPLPILDRALQSLDEPKRLILILSYHRGLTLAQTANVLEIPLGTLKSRLNAALAELRDVLARSSVATHGNEVDTPVHAKPGLTP